MSTQSHNENLYELPNCMICISEMSDDIASLACGHCFHNFCLKQHLEWRNNCPICRKITDGRDLRVIFYNVSLPTSRVQSSLCYEALEEEMKKLRSIIESYEHGAQFCYEKLNHEQQMNMELQEGLRLANQAILSAREHSQKTQTHLKRLLKNSQKKEMVLLQNIKVLKTLLTVKQEKERKKMPVNEESKKEPVEMRSTVKLSEGCYSNGEPREEFRRSNSVTLN